MSSEPAQTAPERPLEAPPARFDAESGAGSGRWSPAPRIDMRPNNENKPPQSASEPKLINRG
jgi:hypothetical protein